MASQEGVLPFKLIEDDSGEALTSFGGLPLVVETCEALGLPRLVNRHVRVKQRDRGYRESTYVQSVIALIAAGGDCLDDMGVIGAGAGVKVLFGGVAAAGGG